ncbi:MAG TPA: GMC family oxidoreductase N-terminal domain-containing protein [Planctomycetota bacterium]|nr:GMC family oxidoreductase N-terminal domain-containing protein [Planctomycetota bacterium]
MIRIDPRRGPLDLRAESVVVGSGAGGAAAAFALAEAGRDVLLLEAGPHHDPATFDQREATMMPRLYVDGGAQTTVDQSMVVLAGRGLGGSTTHNTGLCVPPPPAILDRFDREAGLPGGRAAVDAATAETLRRLGARPMRPEDENRSNRLLREGARRLGLETFEPLHNRELCDRCGYCVLGCAYNRKRHAVFSFLEDAVARGLRIATEARATRIRRAADGWRVEGPGFRAEARRVFVAASALGTPALLLCSGLGNRGALGRNLRLHPFAPVAALFDDDVEAYRGVPQSVLVTGRARFLRGERGGYVLMAAAAGPASTAALAPGFGADVRELMRARRRLASAGVLLHDEAPSRVTARRDGRPEIRAWPTGDDVRDLRDGVTTLARLWFAAGARRVVLPYAARPFVDREEDLAGLERLPFRPYDVALSSVHPQASVPLGRDASAPATPDGALRGAPGVYVADASLFPSSIGVPPQVAVSAFALCVARAAAAAAAAVGGRPA